MLEYRNFFHLGFLITDVGLGFSVRSRPAAPLQDAVTTERQLEAAKIQKAQLEEIIKQLEQREEKQIQSLENREKQT
jgi:hypothetical protein